MEGDSIVIKRQLAVVYIDVNKILFYVKDTKNNLSLNLPLDVVSDLEVVARDKFDQLIDSFFQMDGLRNMGFDIILVFSQGITFEKDFATDTIKAEHEGIQKFLDMVPFEDVLSNTYKINKKTKVVAVNRNLYDILRQALERNKAYVTMAVSMAVLIEINPEFSSNFNLALIVAKADSLKQYGLVDISEGSLEREHKNSIGIKKKDMRLYMLLGIFALLFIILLVLMYVTFFSSPKVNKNPVTLPKTSVIPDVVNETMPVASESGELSSSSSLLKSTSSSLLKSL
nr:hypothetical protein [Candidatus Levybacteria bacterium]